MVCTKAEGSNYSKVAFSKWSRNSDLIVFNMAHAVNGIINHTLDFCCLWPFDSRGMMADRTSLHLFMSAVATWDTCGSSSVEICVK